MARRIPDQQQYQSQPDQAMLLKVRTQLRANPAVFFAGELVGLAGKIDSHDLFVAPVVPTFEPRQLTDFMNQSLRGIKFTSVRRAQMHSDGGMQMPDAFVDEEIDGQRIGSSQRLALALSVILNRQEIGEVEPTIQRTKVRVYTDLTFAQIIFGFCTSLAQKTLDQRRSTNLFKIYATHTASAEQLNKLKQNSQQSPILPRLSISR